MGQGVLRVLPRRPAVSVLRLRKRGGTVRSEQPLSNSKREGKFLNRYLLSSAGRLCIGQEQKNGVGSGTYLYHRLTYSVVANPLWPTITFENFGQVLLNS